MDANRDMHLPITGPPVAHAPVAGGRRHLPGMDRVELRGWFTTSGQEAYRADQLLQWIYERRAASFDAMSNLSKGLRTWLADSADLYTARVSVDSGAPDGTHKLLLTFPDQRSVECVWIPDGDRHTACVSSQVGCPVGCKFCASGLDGVERNLTTGEIVEQALHIAARIAADPATRRNGKPGRLSNIVFMGMGEPLANYESVIAAIRILNADWGCGIGARKITLSTVGLPRQIRRLADEQMQINLALSLHAPDEELRRELIPWGKVPLDDLLDACAYFFAQTGREITLEYVLLAGVNDRPGHAVRLANIVKRLRCNVNLLRYNPVAGLPFQRPSSEEAFAFQNHLRERGVNAHIRTSRGSEIDAACGQLRRAAGLKSTAPAQPPNRADAGPAAP